jgi:hypothetical protein
VEHDLDNFPRVTGHRTRGHEDDRENKPGDGAALHDDLLQPPDSNGSANSVDRMRAAIYQ